jgi:hypothetical protein
VKVRSGRKGRTMFSDPASLPFMKWGKSEILAEMWGGRLAEKSPSFDGVALALFPPFSLAERHRNG